MLPIEQLDLQFGVGEGEAEEEESGAGGGDEGEAVAVENGETDGGFVAGQADLADEFAVFVVPAINL